MSLRERLTLTTVATVAITAGMVGVAGHLAGGDTGAVAGQAVAAGAAFGVSALLARAVVLLPFEDQIGELVSWIRRPETDAKIDPELEHVGHALRMRIHDLKVELERLAREARVAEEGL